jgi:hypothetical protein
VIYDLLKTPEQFVAHFERYAASVVSIIGFGRRISNSQDSLISEVLAQMQHAAHFAVVAKDFPRIMETFPCKRFYTTLKIHIHNNPRASKVSALYCALDAPRPKKW